MIHLENNKIISECLTFCEIRKLEQCSNKNGKII